LSVFLIGLGITLPVYAEVVATDPPNSGEVTFNSNLPCTYTVTPTSVIHGHDPETSIFTVIAPEECAWTATSNDRWWIRINEGENGQGNGTVTYSVASNNNYDQSMCISPAPLDCFIDSEGRYGTLTVAGQTVTIQQLGQADVGALPIIGETGNFKGGISVNGQTHQRQVVLNLMDTVDVSGSITADPADGGKTADIFVYAEATLPSSTEVVYFMLGEGLAILQWDKNPTTLVAFKRNVMSTSWDEVFVPIYSGHFIYPGTLKVFFGYRLEDETLVVNDQPIDITILP
jgi:hypothetical protein